MSLPHAVNLLRCDSAGNLILVPLPCYLVTVRFSLARAPTFQIPARQSVTRLSHILPRSVLTSQYGRPFVYTALKMVVFSSSVHVVSVENAL